MGRTGEFGRDAQDTGEVHDELEADGSEDDLSDLEVGPQFRVKQEPLERVTDLVLIHFQRYGDEEAAASTVSDDFRSTPVVDEEGVGNVEAEILLSDVLVPLGDDVCRVLATTVCRRHRFSVGQDAPA